MSLIDPLAGLLVFFRPATRQETPTAPRRVSCRGLSSEDMEFAAWCFALGSMSLIAVSFAAIRIFLEGIL